MYKKYLPLERIIEYWKPKIISKDSKIPVEIFSQQQHEEMPSNIFCNPWQNDSTLTN